MGTDLFFGTEAPETVTARRKREAEAKAVCYSCAVQVECVADALKFGDEGVRGGMTRHERNQLAPKTFAVNEWRTVAHSAGLSGAARLERRDLDPDRPTYRVIKRDKVLKQTFDETEAWIALHNADL